MIQYADIAGSISSQYMQLRQIECRSCFCVCVSLIAGRGSIVIRLDRGSGGSRCCHFLKSQDTGPAGWIGLVPGDGDVRQKHVQIACFLPVLHRT